MFELWYKAILTTCENYLTLVFVPLSQEFQGTALLLLTLYFVIFGLMLLKGGSLSMFATFITTVIIFTTVYELVYTDKAAGFMNWFYHPIYNTSLNLTAFFTDPTNPSAKMSDIFISAESVFQKLLAALFQQTDSNIGFFSKLVQLVPLAVWGLIMLGYGIVYAAFAVFTLIGFVSMHILMVPAPIILIFAGIPFTRHIFTAWLKAIFTMALIPPFCGIVMGIGNVFITDAASDIMVQETVYNPKVFLIFVIFAIVFFLLQKTPEWAAALTGGTISSVGGLGGTIAGAVGGVTAGAGVMNKIANKTGISQGGAKEVTNAAKAGWKASWGQKHGKQGPDGWKI